MSRVLLLNLDYEPLNICELSRAMKLLLVGKADTLHFYEGKSIYTGGGDCFNIPSVIRLRHNIKRKHTRDFKVSRVGVFSRDSFACQYCGVKSTELTLDHVYPRHMGGTHTWDNLVACCRRCNAYKGWKTLEQSGLKLLSKPKQPRYCFQSVLCRYQEIDESWSYYLVS
jgi:5-methylcytosine-specific restriction endonuclease McrA